MQGLNREDNKQGEVNDKDVKYTAEGEWDKREISILSDLMWKIQLMYCKSESEYNNKMKEVLSSNNVTETVKQLEGLKRWWSEEH